MNSSFRRIFAAVFSIWILLIPVFAAESLIPVGQVIGLELSSGSVTVAAYDDACSAGREAGVQIGDRILAIDGREVSCAKDVREALDRSDGTVELLLSRDKGETTLTLEPQISADGPKMGLYLRQGITGIGTVTFYDPESQTFGTLGHGVSDNSDLLPMTRGNAYAAQVVSVRMGRAGEPGQLKGALASESPLGTLSRNTTRGVFGQAAIPWPGETIPVAQTQQIRTGAATIRSTVDSSGPRDYSVEILKIYPKNHTDGRNLLLRVTDPALLAATGGIVQGMSGSPIIQDGKLVGAVTHVLVNDPTRGYGIFIENMLEAAS